MRYDSEVVQAVALENNHIAVYFSDGRITKYDVNPLIEKGGVFKRLENHAFFTDRLTVMNNTAAWDVSGKYDPTNCIDIDPETLYHAEQINDPLEENDAALA